MAGQAAASLITAGRRSWRRSDPRRQDGWYRAGRTSDCASRAASRLSPQPALESRRRKEAFAAAQAAERSLYRRRELRFGSDGRGGPAPHGPRPWAGGRGVPPRAARPTSRAARQAGRRARRSENQMQRDSGASGEQSRSLSRAKADLEVLLERPRSPAPVRRRRRLVPPRCMFPAPRRRWSHRALLIPRRRLRRPTHGWRGSPPHRTKTAI